MLTFACLSFGANVQAQTLVAGDIAFTGFNADVDAFSFVLLRDINNGTSINFTDNGWQSSGSFRNNEGILTWTAGSDLTCGTQVKITGTTTASTGTVSSTGTGSFALSTSGDQILAYQGAVGSPTFITAINFAGTTWASNATTANNSALPAGLTNGTTAISPGATENGRYKCTANTGVSTIKAAIFTASNWDISASTVYSLPPTCTFSCTQQDCAGVNGGTAAIDGCGVCAGGTTGITPDPDADSDGTLDCDDDCPNDPNKIAPGICGCGVPETVADAGLNDTICMGQTASLTATGGGTYAWSNGGNTASISPAPTVTTTYYVTVTANGCAAVDSAKVVVNNLPAANAGPDDETCLGTSVTLTATGGVSYLWSTASNTNTTVVSPTVSTTYTVTVTDANGCSATDNVAITVNQLPTVDAGANDTICAGETASLTATGAGAYAWSNGGNTATIAPVPTATTTYTVTVTDANGCIATDNAQVVVNQLPIADAGVNDTICVGETASLTATGGGTYAWSNGGNTATITPAPATTTTYTVTVTDGNGCQATDNAVVVANNPPTIAVANDSSVCVGSTFTLTASGAATYNWGNGLTGASVNVTVTGNAVYTVTATDANGCVSTASITLSSLALPTASAGNDATICLGDTTTLLASGGVSYAWSNSINTAANEVSPADTTEYIVTVTAANGCADTDTVTVNILPLPTAFAGNDQAICAGATANLTATGGVNYNWSNGANTAATTVTPTGDTALVVIVQDANGCLDTDTVAVVVNPLPVIDLTALDSTFCIEDGVIALTAIPSGGAFTGAGVSGNSFDPDVTGVGIHTISYAYTDNNGCANTGQVDLVIEVCSGVNEVGGRFSVKVYPNPFSDVLNVSVETTNGESLSITLRDMAGKTISQTHAVANNGLTAIETGNLSVGMYLLEVKSAAGTKSVKLIKN